MTAFNVTFSQQSQFNINYEINNTNVTFASSDFRLTFTEQNFTVSLDGIGVQGPAGASGAASGAIPQFSLSETYSEGQLARTSNNDIFEYVNATASAGVSPPNDIDQSHWKRIAYADDLAVLGLGDLNDVIFGEAGTTATDTETAISSAITSVSYTDNAGDPDYIGIVFSSVPTGYASYFGTDSRPNTAPFTLTIAQSGDSSVRSSLVLKVIRAFDFGLVSCVVLLGTPAPVVPNPVDGEDLSGISIVSVIRHTAVTPSNGDVIQYDSALNNWTNAPALSGGTSISFNNDVYIDRGASTSYAPISGEGIAARSTFEIIFHEGSSATAGRAFIQNLFNNVAGTNFTGFARPPTNTASTVTTQGTLYFEDGAEVTINVGATLTRIPDGNGVSDLQIVRIVVASGNAPAELASIENGYLLYRSSVNTAVANPIITTDDANAINLTHSGNVVSINAGSAISTSEFQDDQVIATSGISYTLIGPTAEFGLLALGITFTATGADASEIADNFELALSETLAGERRLNIGPSSIIGNEHILHFGDGTSVTIYGQGEPVSATERIGAATISSTSSTGRVSCIISIQNYPQIDSSSFTAAGGTSLSIQAITRLTGTASLRTENFRELFMQTSAASNDATLSIGEDIARRTELTPITYLGGTSNSVEATLSNIDFGGDTITLQNADASTNRVLPFPNSGSAPLSWNVVVETAPALPASEENGKFILLTASDGANVRGLYQRVSGAWVLQTIFPSQASVAAAQLTADNAANQTRINFDSNVRQDGALTEIRQSIREVSDRVSFSEQDVLTIIDCDSTTTGNQAISLDVQKVFTFGSWKDNFLPVSSLLTEVLTGLSARPTVAISQNNRNLSPTLVAALNQATLSDNGESAQVSYSDNSYYTLRRFTSHATSGQHTIFRVDLEPYHSGGLTRNFGISITLPDNDGSLVNILVPNLRTYPEVLDFVANRASSSLRTRFNSDQFAHADLGLIIQDLLNTSMLTNQMGGEYTNTLVNDYVVTAALTNNQVYFQFETSVDISHPSLGTRFIVQNPNNQYRVPRVHNASNAEMYVTQEGRAGGVGFSATPIVDSSGNDIFKGQIPIFRTGAVANGTAQDGGFVGDLITANTFWLNDGIDFTSAMAAVGSGVTEKWEISEYGDLTAPEIASADINALHSGQLTELRLPLNTAISAQNILAFDSAESNRYVKISPIAGETFTNTAIFAHILDINNNTALGTGRYIEVAPDFIQFNATDGIVSAYRGNNISLELNGDFFLYRLGTPTTASSLTQAVADARYTLLTQALLSRLKNNGAKAFNRTDGVLTHINISLNGSMYTQRFNRTNSVLTSISYHNGENQAADTNVFFRKTFARTNNILTSISTATS